MPLAIYVLALATFAVGTQTSVFTGLLSDLASDLEVSVAVAGQLATVFAITSAISAPFIVNTVSRWERKRVLIISLIFIGVINLATSALPTFDTFLYARIVVALFSGIVIPTAGAVAVSMVQSDKQGQALGVILSGLTLAFVLGIPMGSVVGGQFGWRSTFVFAGVIAFIAIPFIMAYVPALPGTQAASLSNFKVLTIRIVQVGLVLSGISFIAGYPIFAFIGPLVEEITGISGSAVGLLQTFIGFGSILGIIAGGRMADHGAFTRNIRILFAGFVVVQFFYSVWFLLPGLGTTIMAIPLVITIFFSSAILFALGPVIEKALVQAAPEQSSLTLAMNSSMIYMGQGLGAALGGFVIGSQGYPPLGVLSAGIAITALVIAITFRSKSKSRRIPPTKIQAES